MTDKERVQAIYPRASASRRGTRYTIVRPRTPRDPKALVPYVTVSRDEWYTEEEAWSDAVKQIGGQS